MKPTISEAEGLLHAMSRAELRKNRYNVIGLDASLVEELTGLLRNRNEVTWMAGEFEPPSMQFDFNGLWFDSEFKVWRF